MIKITDSIIKKIGEKIRASGRKRCNYNFHKDFKDPIQRLINVADFNSYIRPHKHENPDKIEIFIILKGKVLILEFDEKGRVIDNFVLDSLKGNFGVEIAPRVWHSFISLEDGSCVYEIKEGPYDSASDKTPALWAPEEGMRDGEEFNKKILRELNIL